MQNVLLTGSAELIGGHVLAALAGRIDIERIIVLTRQPEGGTASSALHFPRSKIEFLIGDVRQPNFGLPERAWKELGQRINRVFDCTESQRLACAAAQDRVAAAANWIEFLRKHEHLQLSYLSSAFVAGRRRGLFTEFDLDCGQSFHNEWERANFEAERLLRASPVSQRATIFRPSLTVGEAQTGRAAAFTGFYRVLHLLRQRRLKLLAAHPSTRLDVVPVDFVAAAIIALSGEQEMAGKNYHLVAGWQQSITVQALVRAVATYARLGATQVRFVPPFMSWLARGTASLTCGRAAGSKLTAAYCSSIFRGYWKGDALPEDGWFRTGDIGYLRGDRLFVSGREKEMLIVNGENIFPNDIENALQAIPDIRECLAMFEDEQLYLLVIPASSTDLQIEGVSSFICANFGITPRAVVKAKANHIVRTTSGKPMRYETLAEARRRGLLSD